MRCDVTMPSLVTNLDSLIGRLLVLEHGQVLRQHDAAPPRRLSLPRLRASCCRTAPGSRRPGGCVRHRVGANSTSSRLPSHCRISIGIDIAARRHDAALALAVPIVEQPQQAGIADRGRIVQADEGHGVIGLTALLPSWHTDGLRRSIPVDRFRAWSAVAPGAACAARDRCRPGPRRPWRRRLTAAGSASAAPPPRACELDFGRVVGGQAGIDHDAILRQDTTVRFHGGHGLDAEPALGVPNIVARSVRKPSDCGNGHVARHVDHHEVVGHGALYSARPNELPRAGRAPTWRARTGTARAAADRELPLGFRCRRAPWFDCR